MAPDEDEQSELDEIEQLRSSPLRVLGITFPPDLKTRSEKVLREFKPTISARTLEEVLKCTDETLVNLEDLGVFHEIDAEIVQGRSVRLLPIQLTATNSLCHSLPWHGPCSHITTQRSMML